MADGPIITIATADVLAIDRRHRAHDRRAILRARRERIRAVASRSRRLLASWQLARGIFARRPRPRSGSAIRKIPEVAALEDARTWAAPGVDLPTTQFVVSAGGEALSRLGESSA